MNSSASTVALTVPFGTTVASLVPSFVASSGATVKVGSTTQTSGTTANDFTNPVVYTIVAQDGSTKTYTVTVTVSPNTSIFDAVNNGFSVFPNPADDNLEVNFTNTTVTGKIRVMNPIGIIVYENSFNTTHTINLTSFEAGLYMLSILKEDNTLLKTQKIIVR